MVFCTCLIFKATFLDKEKYCTICGGTRNRRKGQ